ncbi:hypothetical protein [Polaromonas aquatica]|uniref:hypothetical protein n=1 Tax=Polaromonas aquatica TaxID=332657 RepID=UPI003D65F1DB
MTTMQLLLQTLVCITLVATLVIAPIAWFCMVRAQTRSAYWKNMVFFAAPILLTFLLADAAGLMPEASPPPSEIPEVEDVLAGIPTGQLILLSLAAALWVGGGNVLLYRHRRRLGKKWWQALNPFDPPFKDFNTAEWLTLGGLAAGSLALGALAVSYGPGAL